MELDRPIPKTKQKEFDFWKKQTITKLKNKENFFRLDLIRLIKRIKYIKNKKSFSSIDKRYLPPNEKQTSIVLKNLKAIKKIAEAQNTKFILLHFPSSRDFSEPAIYRPEIRSKVLSNLCDEAGCFYLDFYDNFKNAAEGNKLEFFININQSAKYGHFSLKGSKQVAKGLTEFINNIQK